MVAYKQLVGTPVPHAINGYRLSAHPTLSVPSGDVIGATTLNAVAHTGGQVGLLDTADNGTLYTGPVAVASAALSGMVANTNYDAFLFNNAGVLAVERGAAWASDVSRTDAIVFVNGVNVKSADHTRRWLGTFRATSPTTYEDSEAKPWVWNWDNRVMRTARASGPVATATSTSTSFATIDAAFDLTVLSPGASAMLAELTLFLANGSAVAQDAAFAVLVGANDYELSAAINDTTAIQRYTARRLVPLPSGASLCRARWAIVGGGGSLVLPASARAAIQRVGACSLQLTYPR